MVFDPRLQKRKKIFEKNSDQKKANILASNFKKHKFVVKHPPAPTIRILDILVDEISSPQKASSASIQF